MISHAFNHIFGEQIKKYKNILLIGHKNNRIQISHNTIMLDDLNYNIINSANKDAYISSVLVDIPNINKTTKLDNNYDLISIFTNNDDVDSKSIDVLCSINNNATLLVTNKMINKFDLSNKIIIPIVYDINVILPKHSSTRYSILPLIDLNYNFNTSHISMQEDTTLYVSRVSPNKVTMSYLRCKAH